MDRTRVELACLSFPVS